jgi:Abnormal spindle-like microcephaly-assoc'd, ASPM-SPD-2-Hydin
VPAGVLAVDPDGNVFGATEQGGVGPCTRSEVIGCGTVFRLTPPKALGDVWNETALYSFEGGTDGTFPMSSLLFGKAGVRYGTTSQGGTGNCSITLNGCGTVFEIDLPAQSVTLSPPTLNFGSEAVGSSSVQQATSLGNFGSSSLTVTNITITGADYQDFSQSNNCPSSLAVGASCVVKVTFTPQAQGARTATLTITDNGEAGQQSVPLEGKGT